MSNGQMMAPVAVKMENMIPFVQPMNSVLPSGLTVGLERMGKPKVVFHFTFPVFGSTAYRRELNEPKYRVPSLGLMAGVPTEPSTIKDHFSDPDREIASTVPSSQPKYSVPSRATTGDDEISAGCWNVHSNAPEMESSTESRPFSCATNSRSSLLTAGHAVTIEPVEYVHTFVGSFPVVDNA